MRLPPARRRESGSAAAAAIVLVAICGAVAAGALISNVGATREAETLLARERAFQAAEAGIDWAITKMRIFRADMDVLVSETGTLDAAAGYTITYSRGTEDGLDENGDGTIDDSGESDFYCVTATGQAGEVRRSLQVVLRKAVEVPAFTSATYINDMDPILDVDGNAFTISGSEHFIDGTEDGTRDAKYAVASPAPASDLIAQIPLTRVDNIVGIGAIPSVGQVAEIDVAALIDQMKDAATIVLAAGTHSTDTYGTATENGIEVVYCAGDLSLSGGTGGAGVLVVEGDLDISGGFEWVGMVLVGGSVRLTGGGGGKRIIGVLCCEEEVLSISGTVDLYYSSDAIELASNALNIPMVLSWRETGNP